MNPPCILERSKDLLNRNVMTLSRDLNLERIWDPCLHAVLKSSSSFTTEGFSGPPPTYQSRNTCSNVCIVAWSGSLVVVVVIGTGGAVDDGTEGNWPAGRAGGSTGARLPPPKNRLAT